MLNSVLFGSYCMTLGGLGYLAVKAKMMDDWEREIKDMREFNYEDETLREGKGKAMVLAKIKQDLPEGSDGILLRRRIASSNVLDPTRYFKTKIMPGEELTLDFLDSDDNADTPLSVKLGKNSQL